MRPVRYSWLASETGALGTLVIVAWSLLCLWPTYLQLKNNSLTSSPLHIHINNYLEKRTRTSASLRAVPQSAATQNSANVEDQTASGIVTSSLLQATNAANVPYAIANKAVELLSARFDFHSDLRPGDKFSVIYREKPLALQAFAIFRARTILAAFQYPDGSGHDQYFDERGQLVGNYFLRYPLHFTHISSSFAQLRLHPLLGVLRPHNGVDFAAARGTPVHAVADGVVKFAGYKPNAGYMVKLLHASGYATEYLHLSSITRGLQPGTKVARGETIGAVGMSGLATAPHLHFGLYKNGRYLDPISTALPTIVSTADTMPIAAVELVLATLRSVRDTAALASNSALRHPA